MLNKKEKVKGFATRIRASKLGHARNNLVRYEFPGTFLCVYNCITHNPE